MHSEWKLAWAVAVVCMMLGTAAVAQNASITQVSEADSLKNITQLFNDPATPAATFDTAVDLFREAYPQSKKMLPVLVTAVRFHRLHGNYLPELHYGLLALQLDPHDLYVLSSLGMAIPDNVKTTDLDMDQRLSQAENFDQQVLAVTGGFQITAGGLSFGGRHYTQAQGQTLRDNLNSGAYLSLGRIATARGKYPEAVAAFEKAITFQPELAEQAQSYYQIGVAQAGAKNVSAARAAFAKARQLAPKSGLLQRMVQIAEDKLADGGL